MVRRIEGLAETAAEFDGYILDQWGVLHDGTTLYDGVVESLARMHAAGKKVVILSNSGRLSAYNRATLGRMGIPASLYKDIVTAGEVAHQALRSRSDPAHRALGRRCFAFARPQDSEFFDGLDLDLVKNPAEADFLCVVGFEPETGLVAMAQPALDAALARNLPMVCANPDFARLTPSGLVEAPGVVAREYQRRGGAVLWHGKPHASVYAASRRLMTDIPSERIVAVGDSIEHDICGARDAGIRSILVAGGIHSADLGVAFGALPLPAVWRKFAETASASPQFLIAKFLW
ncbi:MAG: TIGR01459 family HAD-type hydrolase [Proteobacteria bacterium]|nr:TIGR01459 family HAD-type hydrolase [Pseudomonadota bacterium]